jgi:predicted deacetylase
MNWAVWQRIEQFLDAYRVCPILAVVPDNKDQELNVSAPRPDFWNQVRIWQDKGWTIGVHGYQHLYVTEDSGILRLNQRSEFAGLPYEVQLAKLRSATTIFERESILPQVWVAPSHSFDWQTVQALKGTGIRIISDGLSRFPHLDSSGMLWVPQQLWRFRAVPAGIWTVCFHHNRWGDAQLERFRSELDMYAERISHVPEVVSKYANRERSACDRLQAAAVYGFIRASGYYDRLMQTSRKRSTT